MSTPVQQQLTVSIPAWVPKAARVYLEHVENGRSIRAIARDRGCHASTIMRQVRRYEGRRDDLLIDLALRRLGRTVANGQKVRFGEYSMIHVSQEDQTRPSPHVPDDDEVRRVAPRILRRMNEAGACMAIARDMENAVVARETSDGRTLRTAVVERHIAEAMALNDWISVVGEGRITKYKITSVGRMALKRFLAEEEEARVTVGETGDPYSEQHRDWATKDVKDANKRRGIRYNAAESPLSTLSRRKDRSGEPFLSPDLVAAGERLREDFELAQMGPRVTQNWDKFLTSGTQSSPNFGSERGGSEAARTRVMTALKELGPGLGDVVLRCCCYLEGMESVEKRMGWSARSGKIVLRIALGRLKAHYDEGGNWSPLIG